MNPPTFNTLRKRKLSPWDENGYFNTPTVSYFSIGAANTRFLIVKADPQRVGLIICSTTGGTINVAPDPNISINGFQGIPLLGSTLPLMIHQKDWGPLVAVEWWGVTTALNQTGTVIELYLREWPIQEE